MQGCAPWIHLDVLDGTLYPYKSWFDPARIRTWDEHINIELHLMVKRPANVLAKWRGSSRIKRVIWHVESSADHLALAKRCRARHLETGLAIAPTSTLRTITPYLSAVDELLVMGIEPGRSGQTLIPETVQTLDALHALAPKLSLGFDGGVNARTIRSLIRHGATRLCTHSMLFDTPDPALTYRRLHDLITSL